MSVLLSKADFDKFLQILPEKGKRILAQSKDFSARTGFPAKILEDYEITNEAEVHEHEEDLWYCVEGEATFITRGKLVSSRQSEKDPREWKGSGIEGGEEIVLHVGDWLWIPAGEPHQHRSSSLARLVIIKIPSLP